MTYKELLQQIEKKELHGAYLFEGTEENLKDEAIRVLRQTILPEGLEELNGVVMEDPASEELIAAAETIPFMADQRLVIVREMSGITKGETDEKLIRYLPQIPPTAVVVFFVRGKADARKKIPALLKKSGKIVSFDPLRDAELTEWIIGRFRDAGQECPPASALRLTFIAGSDLNTLAGEIEKIASYTAERGTVTEADVEALATPTVESNVFRMIDDLVDGKVAASLTRMRSMLVHGESGVGILAMLLRQYRMLQHVKIMQYEKKGQDVMAQMLGVQSFIVRNCVRQAQKYTGGQVKRAVAICLDAEYRFKAGLLRDENSVLESVMLQLIALRMEN